MAYYTYHVRCDSHSFYWQPLATQVYQHTRNSRSDMPCWIFSCGCHYIIRYARLYEVHVRHMLTLCLPICSHGTEKLYRIRLPNLDQGRQRMGQLGSSLGYRTHHCYLPSMW